MRWLKSHFGSSSSTSNERIVRLASEACLADVRRRITADLNEMTLSETRGYVAARARRPVRREISRLLLAEGGRDNRQFNELVGYATTIVASRLVREHLLLQSPTRSQAKAAA